MLPEFYAEFTYEIKCAKCGRVEKQRCWVSRNFDIPLPVRPEGWFIVDGLIYCDKHTFALVDVPPKEQPRE